MAEARETKSSTTEGAVTKKSTKKTPEQEKEILESIKKADKEIVEKEAKEIVGEKDAEVITKKAGKHSAKGLKEEQEKLEKIDRQKHKEEQEAVEESKPKVIQKPARPHHERKGKKYRESYKLINKDTEYSLADAIALAKKTSTVKFDASVELHVKLNVDPKHADQNIRESIVLPAGTGKKLIVAVFAEPEDAKKAKTAGADIVGEDDFLQRLDKGQFDFDVLVSTPKLMARLGKYAKDLGPRGLMPNPKSGTVTNDVAKAVTESKGGKVEYRVDSTGIVHLATGKVSFSDKDLATNIETVLASIKNAKPTSIKGIYVASVYLSTSMGPSIKVANNVI